MKYLLLIITLCVLHVAPLRAQTTAPGMPASNPVPDHAAGHDTSRNNGDNAYKLNLHCQRTISGRNSMRVGAVCFIAGAGLIYAAHDNLNNYSFYNDKKRERARLANTAGILSVSASVPLLVVGCILYVVGRSEDAEHQNHIFISGHDNEVGLVYRFR